MKLSARWLRLLKVVHLVTASCWIGGAVSLILLYFAKSEVRDPGVLVGINASIHHVDMMVVVIPGAFGCLITGLGYSLFSHWGFFRHRWIAVKWVITISAILFGTFYLGPWEENMLRISEQIGIKAVDDPDYLYSQRMNLICGIIQTSILIATVWVSVFKPWKRKS